MLGHQKRYEGLFNFILKKTKNPPTNPTLGLWKPFHPHLLIQFQAMKVKFYSNDLYKKKTPTKLNGKGYFIANNVYIFS